MELYAKSGPEWTPLEVHLQWVGIVVRRFAKHLGLNEDIAFHGAILHDIGKAHPVFQSRLKGESNRHTVFRHEISSLFFLPAFPEEEWPMLIEMVVGHHKSVKKNINRLGLLDIDQYDDYEEFHLGDWNNWSAGGMRILANLSIPPVNISTEEALDALAYCIAYCKKTVKEKAYSMWRGLLMGADHFASSLAEKTPIQVNRIFKSPDLSFYSRQHPLYPLSYIDSTSEKSHTIVVACTGAGKTDFLFRRCRERVFYTLPFQASINAMFRRIEHDLEKMNPDMDLRVLHSTSKIVRRQKETEEGEKEEETALQDQIGSSVKILTPHQLAALVFGMKGYESLILDVQGCDVILDEVHTYSGVSQALVLKLIEALRKIGCRIHIGTATMPGILYHKIEQILGDNVLKVSLSEEDLDFFNRHIIHKIEDFEIAIPVIRKAVGEQQKVLLVMNTVKKAQSVYTRIRNEFSGIDTLLLHSRFRRKDRNHKEEALIGLDANGTSTGSFNTSSNACIVVSTQIVEVSLDISFDVMITETAPLDALIQRFGRINRKRSVENLGKLKPVYVIAPTEEKQQDSPYKDWNVIKQSYNVLPDNEILKERNLQTLIDSVFTNIEVIDIEEHSLFLSNGNLNINKLTHHGRAILSELLEVESVPCILESDQEAYEKGSYETRLGLEINVNRWTVKDMEQTEKGNRPFIIPDSAYDQELGLDREKVKNEYLNVLNRFL